MVDILALLVKASATRGDARCRGGQNNSGRTDLVSGTWSCTHSSRSAEPGPSDRLVPARAPSRAAPQRRPTRSHTGRGVQRSADAPTARLGAAGDGVPVRQVAPHRQAPPCTGCLSLIWAPADAAATRHTRAPTCMAARMREGTQAHTASCMSAFPRAPAQARHGCGMSRRTSYRAPFADGHFVVRVRGRGRRGGTARRLLRRLRRLEYFVRLFSLPSSRGLSRGAHPSWLFPRLLIVCEKAKSAWLRDSGEILFSLQSYHKWLGDKVVKSCVSRTLSRTLE
jgi:hypothetical protein